MISRGVILASLLAVGAIVAAAPADARGWGWTVTGPHGGTATVNGWGRPGWGWGPCCYGGGVAAGAVAGLAVGTAVGVAAASHPVYVAPPPVVYAAPPVVYAPGGYYYYVP
ncbi:MAG: hypothetical protein J0I21_08785 [Alphaproteobacteria bacterium]|nr:hypothetical protein [Alphaproteobacteria bacterium]